MAKTKFEIYKDNKGNYRWRLLAQNGEPVASSGEGFSEKRTAMNAVKKLKDWANTDNILDVEKAKEDAIKAKAKADADAKKMKEAEAKKKAAAKNAPAKKAAPAKSASKAAPKKVAAKSAAPKKVAAKKEVTENKEEKSTPSVM